MDFTKSAECYRKIVIRGVVQGMGFRPFVLRLANRLDIRGTVCNKGGGLLILAAGGERAMNEFIGAIKNEAPVASRITDMLVSASKPFASNDFHIAESGADTKQDNAFILPDIGICDDCLRDISDKDGRRYAHPFNSCVECGPRFTITGRLPYDRENTAMEPFPLCDGCETEYTSAGDRRCHAQTVCCNDCGPKLLMYDGSGGVYEGADALRSTVSALLRGEIVAVKGIGGYHFACSPNDSKAVSALRKLKGRDKKPFAVMLRDMVAVREICHASEPEEQILTSPARPITLLGLKRPVFAEETLCGDVRCGCFLPYTALHRLLLEDLGMLVLTSANSGGGAIIKDDPQMRDFFERSGCERWTGVLYNGREILRAAEDSVAQAAAGQIQLLRRSRGYVPDAVVLENKSGREFIAMGGDLKSAFCVVKNSYAYQGAYTGDLEEKSVYDRFRLSAREFAGVLGVTPSFVMCDMHPGYFSALIAEEWGLPVTRVQHHHAHIASVMAEHGLTQKVLGLAFDGTGYGEDGCVWGGEFLVCEGAHYRRAGHLDYTRLLGGDSGAQDAKKTAFCFLYESADDLERLDIRANLLKAALKADVNTVRSSSMGRLFDAAAAILGLCDRNSYEGECAVMLQRSAENALKSAVKPYPLRFEVKDNGGLLLADAKGVARDMFLAASHAESGALTLGFHLAAAELAENICVRLRELESCNDVALSGGVFQNKLLLELTLEKLTRQGFRVYINNMTSPNDGGISLGQAYIGGKLECV